MQSEYINFHIQTLSNDSSIVNLFLQSYNTSDNPVQLTLQYTDTYHDDAIFYKSITYDIYLFAVDPPTFTRELQGINATRWIDYTFNLPLVSDVNNLDWKVSLVDSPSWISLNSNNSIFLSLSNINIQIPETTLLTIKITNSMNAWSEYNLTINVQSVSIPIFGKINDVLLSRNNTNILKIGYEGDSAVIIVDCSYNVQIPWIYFNETSHELIMNTKYVNLESQWVMLKAYDSCNREVYSNRFKISILSKSSLYIGNTFGPLLMFIGEKRLFLIPNDLFISSDPSSLKISVQVINWSTSANITAYVEYSKQFESYYLYLNSITSNICHLSLSATDSSDQVIEVWFELDVLSCASKDWLKWTSNLQSGCTEWINNYVLDSTGACLWNSIYLHQPSIDLFNVCGIIVFAILISNLLMMFVLDVSMLQSFEFAQTLIVFIYSASDIDNNKIIFGSWLQISKYDFGFLNIPKFNKLLGWNTDSKLIQMNFYCQTTLLNYFYLILFWVILFAVLKLIKIKSQSSELFKSILNTIEHRISKEDIAWIFIHLLLTFILINIAFEVITIERHLYLSFASFTLIFILIVILVSWHPEIITWSFILSIDRTNYALFTLLTIFKSILHLLMFIANGDKFHTIIEWIEIGIHLLMILISFTHKDNRLEKQDYFLQLQVIKYSFFTLILFFISWSNHLSFSLLSLKAQVMLILLFFVYFTTAKLFQASLQRWNINNNR